MTPTDTEREAITTMTDDDDVTKLDDGRIVRLRIEPDSDASINDYDSDGRIEWTRGNSYGPVRPSDFTGRAQILDRNNGYHLWWEPYHDLTENQIRSERPRIRDLVEYGFCGYILELCDGTDAYGRPIVVDTASLWGIEPFADAAYTRELLGDLLADLQ